MSDVKISFLCPGCDERLGFPGTDAGTIQECPECGGWVDVPELTRSPNLDHPYAKEQDRLWADAVRQNEDNDRLIQMSRTNHDEWKRQMEQSARYQDQAEDTFRRFASLVARWEGLTDRIERFLDAFERNQP
jgi:Zn-finger nucleic acid-binding protein